MTLITFTTCADYYTITYKSMINYFRFHLSAYYNKIFYPLFLIIHSTVPVYLKKKNIQIIH